jgi:hypothetical protein
MRLPLLLTIAALLSPSLASAETITFSPTVTPSPTGCYVEGSFTYCSLFLESVGFYADGNPGQDAEGSYRSSLIGPQYLDIKATSGAPFLFQGLDYAAWQYNDPAELGEVDANGYRGGSYVGGDAYYVAPVDIAAGLPYANWTTGDADYLKGVPIDDLQIVLWASNDHYVYSSAVDNIVLDPIATPEPSALALLTTGMLGLVGALRTRRSLP